MSKKEQYLMGIKAGIPIILGFVPVAIAYAIMAHQAGLSGLETTLMSLLVFAGASQMMAVGMYAQGASLVAIILATFILNLRHLIMSTCVMNRMGNVKTSWKLLTAFSVVDEAFAIFTTGEKEKCSLFYFLGLSTVTYLSWNIGTVIGVITSDFLPVILTASLGIALYAMFIAILMPNIKHNKKLCLLVVITAIVNTILSQFIAASWALIISTLACAALGVFLVGEQNEVEEKHG